MRTTALAAAALIFASPAWALLGDITVQTQAQYQLFEVKQVGLPVESRGGFTTTYNIGLRRPLTPLSKLITNLTVNSIENNDSLGRQQNRTINFNLAAAERTYSINGGIDSVTYRSILSGPDGKPIESDGGNKNLYVNFTWTEPAWPTTNIQFRSNRTGAVAGSSYTTNQWITGAYYDFRPIRITLDQTTQDFRFTSPSFTSTTNTTRRRAGIDFEERLLPGLLLQANLGRETNKSDYSGGRATSLIGTTKNIRFTATPTPSLLLTAERVIQDTSNGTFQDSRNILTSAKTDNTTYSMRSEMLPGLSLTVNHQNSKQTGDLLASINRNISANIAARLTTDTNLALGWNKSSYKGLGELRTGNDQSSLYASLQTPMGYNNDLVVDLGKTQSRSLGSDSFNGKYAGLTWRNRTRSDMSFGLGYHYNWLDTSGLIRNIQKSNSVDLDMSWFPANNMGINARLSYSSNNGSNINDYITPTVDLRWDVSSDSSLTLRYNFNRTRQWDWSKAEIFQQATKGISGRFSYRLSNDSSLDLTYDFLGSDSGGLEWQRALRAYYTMRL